MWVLTVAHQEAPNFISCMHDHKTCMNLFILETYHPHVCESRLKMANGFKCWKGEGMRKGENKGKPTLHVYAETLMWLH